MIVVSRSNDDIAMQGHWEVCNSTYLNAIRLNSNKAILHPVSQAVHRPLAHLPLLPSTIQMDGKRTSAR